MEPRTVRQAFRPACQKPLTDRLVLGQCPVCGADTRGDQCDACGAVPEADTLLHPRCAECGGKVVFKETTQLHLLLTKLEPELRSLLHSHPNWRHNAITFTERYLDEGLRDRAITRDLDWGIDVPHFDFADKKIYIWAKIILGYLSAAKQVCKTLDLDFSDVFGKKSRHYYVHGKDNIPFHTIMLPALLLAEGILRVL